MNRSSPDIPVALLGFTPFERDHLARCLAHRDPNRSRYVVSEELAGSAIVVCNADDDAASAAVAAQGRSAGCLMLGHQPREGAAAQLPRAVQSSQLLRAVAVLAEASPAMTDDMRRVQDELARRTPRRAAAFEVRTAPMSLPLIQAHRRPKLEHVLVIDSDDTVLRFVAEQVQRFGFEAHLAHTLAEGTQRARRRRFEFVFVASGGAEGELLQACRAIKRGPTSTSTSLSRRPPTLVLLQPGDVPPSEAEAEAADAWLHKPLAAPDLLAVMAERELALAAGDATTRAASLY
jgi:CheY-like chemotaxis protein